MSPKTSFFHRLNSWWIRHRYPVLPLLIWLFLSVETMLLFPREGSFSFSSHTLDSISREEIIAPFSFNVEYTPEELAEKRKAACLTIEPVWVYNDSITKSLLSAYRGSVETIRTTGGIIRALGTQRRQANASERAKYLDSLGQSLLENLKKNFNVRLSEASWEFILNRYQADEEFLLGWNQYGTILEEILDRGIMNQSLREVENVKGAIRVIRNGEEQSKPIEVYLDHQSAVDEMLERLRGQIGSTNNPSAEEILQSDAHIRLGYEMLIAQLTPNLLYDSIETESRRQAAVDKIPIVKTIVLKGERIIDSNERITQQHLEKLRALSRKKDAMAKEQRTLTSQLQWFGRFLLAALVLFIFGYWYFRFQSRVFYSPRHLLVISFLIALLVAVYGTIFLPFDLNHNLFPAALGAMIITMVINAPSAFVFSVSLAFLVGALKGTGYFAVLAFIISPVISVFAVLRVRTRVQIMRAALLIFLGLAFVIYIQRQLSLRLDMYLLTDLMYAGINALSTPLLALGMLIAIEWIFGVTSELTLLELGDLNRPLLKRLSMEAPGTYHHSIMVGNLAEAGAEAIHASPLLVRAGAYYHDIGKMLRREYFVENQKGTGNIHDMLEPEQSAEFLRAHVFDGIKLAKEYHLPESIKAFIREHHGTSIMVYFYDKALKLHPDGAIDEALFRYPGPKPQSREAGILMLADAAEAASRSLDNPSSEELRRVVREVVINKYRDQELDECPLTLHDVRLVIDAFLPILEGIHHHRIRYPTRREFEARLKRKKVDETENT